MTAEKLLFMSVVVVIFVKVSVAFVIIANKTKKIEIQ